MKMLTAQQVADKWGVSLRSVQGLCKTGRIIGAEKWGRSWMIPENTIKPEDNRCKRTLSEEFVPIPLIRKSPFLDMTDLYNAPGTAEKGIDSLCQYPEAQALFAAEIAYSRGEIDKVLSEAKRFLISHSGFYAVNAAGMLLALCAMWKGDINLYRQAKKHICEAPISDDIDRDILTLSLACSGSGIRDMSDYPEWFTLGCFGHLPPDSHPSAKVFYIKYLLVVAQDMAKSRFKLDGVSGLGLMKIIPYIAEPMIVQAVVDKTVIPEIYLRLLCAIAYHQTGDKKRAVEHIDKAIELALPDMLLGILAEHRRQLDYLLDERLERASPEAYIKFKELHGVLLKGWTKLHNEVLSRNVSMHLTIREREIARLAAFNVSNAEIAKRLNISMATVKKNLFSAMNKTGTNKREELGAYI